MPPPSSLVSPSPSLLPLFPLLGKGKGKGGHFYPPFLLLWRRKAKAKGDKNKRKIEGEIEGRAKYRRRKGEKKGQGDERGRKTKEGERRGKKARGMSVIYFFPLTPVGEYILSPSVIGADRRGKGKELF